MSLLSLRVKASRERLNAGMYIGFTTKLGRVLGV
jgi:hypothetical protein